MSYDHTAWQRRRDAQQRLTARYRPAHLADIPIGTPEGVEAVTLGMDTQYAPDGAATAATDQDIADAASCLDDARSTLIHRMDNNELTVLDALQAMGWTNQRIGEHLGYDKRTAAAQLGSRIKRLRRKLPGFERPTRPEPGQEPIR